MDFQKLGIDPLDVGAHARIDADTSGSCCPNALSKQVAIVEIRAAMKEGHLGWVECDRARDGEGNGPDFGRSPIVGPLFNVPVLRIFLIEVGLSDALDTTVPGSFDCVCRRCRYWIDGQGGQNGWCRES